MPPSPFEGPPVTSHLSLSTWIKNKIFLWQEAGGPGWTGAVARHSPPARPDLGGQRPPGWAGEPDAGSCEFRANLQPLARLGSTSSPKPGSPSNTHAQSDSVALSLWTTPTSHRGPRGLALPTKPGVCPPAHSACSLGQTRGRQMGAWPVMWVFRGRGITAAPFCTPRGMPDARPIPLVLFSSCLWFLLCFYFEEHSVQGQRPRLMSWPAPQP